MVTGSKVCRADACFVRNIYPDRTTAFNMNTQVGDILLQFGRLRAWLEIAPPLATDENGRYTTLFQAPYDLR